MAATQHKTAVCRPLRRMGLILLGLLVCCLVLAGVAAAVLYGLCVFRGAYVASFLEQRLHEATKLSWSMIPIWLRSECRVTSITL